MRRWAGCHSRVHSRSGEVPSAQRLDQFHERPDRLNREHTASGPAAACVTLSASVHPPGRAGRRPELGRP